ncbi:RPA-interacting protein B isoform X1 [Punica granatum]|uniref:RPA-interacting protein B isoform X1 n=2 Tax=Punica granatum TaxID=22663 RepID=A0A6P8BTB2_PUNGR|nr:RPA-interacting protein B isoform X1 [Punica granatum]PKI75533.1 hypothetical protein CRG98_004069 [Punica granatum]
MADDASAPAEAAKRTRVPLKSNTNFNNYPAWKRKLRENCHKRLREDRTRLLWKIRLPASQSLDEKDLARAAFQDIVSDEFKKIKESSLKERPNAVDTNCEEGDPIWEYNGLHDAYQGDCEEILLEMQRIFYEDLREEPCRLESSIESWEDEEDEYLARAVYEYMQLNVDQAKNEVWCPICKKGKLRENHKLIDCNLCQLKLNKSGEVSLELLRSRLAEAHTEHLDRGCRLKPEFSIETIFNLTALYIICSGCDTFEVVI